MADEARLHDLLDLVEQARTEGDADTEKRATEAYRKATTPQPADPPEGLDIRLGNALAGVAVPALRAFAGDPQAKAEIGHKVLGVPEAILSAASHIPGAIYNAVANKLPGDAGYADTTFQPRTGPGKDLAQGMADTVAPAQEALSRSYDAVAGTGPLATTLKERIPQAVDAVGSLVGGADVAGLGLRAAGRGLADGVRAVAVKGIPKTIEASTPAALAKSQGFTVTANAVGASQSQMADHGLLGDFHSSMRDAEASLDNIPKLNRAVAEEHGIAVDKNSRIEPWAVEKAKEPHYVPYNEARTLRPVAPTDYVADLKSNTSNLKMTTDGQREAANLIEQHAVPGTSDQIVTDIKQLRRQAGQRRIGQGRDAVTDEALADLQIRIANTLEDELGRRAAADGNFELQGQLRAARVKLDQLYVTGRALHGGFVDPELLSTLQNARGDLTGTLGVGAYLGENLPKVFQRPQIAAVIKQGGLSEKGMLRYVANRAVERLGLSLWSKARANAYYKAIVPDATEMQQFQPRKSDWVSRFPGPSDGPFLPREGEVTPLVGRDYPDEPQAPSGHPGEAGYTEPQKMLPAPGQATPPNAVVPDESTLRPMNDFAAQRHPGFARGGLDIADYSADPLAQQEGLPYYDVLTRGGVSRRTRTASGEVRASRSPDVRDPKEIADIIAEKHNREIHEALKAKAAKKKRDSGK